MATFRVVHRLGTFDLDADTIDVDRGMVYLLDAEERVVAVFPADGATAVVQVDAMRAALPAGEAVPPGKPARGAKK